MKLRQYCASMIWSRSFLSIFIFILWNLSPPVMAADTPLSEPINSDPLTQRGINPRVLDVAVAPMSQNLSCEAMVVYQQTFADGSTGSERFRMIFNPDTDYGRDLYIDLETEPLRSARAYRRILEVTMGADHCLRQEERIHQRGSIELLTSTDHEDVIAFRYSPRRIPSSMKWLMRLSGRVFVVDGRLDRIELTGERSFVREGVRHENYHMTVFFGEVKDLGGHVITGIVERFRARLRRKWVAVELRVRMLEYSSEQFGAITWVDTGSAVSATSGMEQLEAPSAAVDELLEDRMGIPVLGELLEKDLQPSDTVRLSLRRRLPFFADKMRKLGFELPKTYGLALMGHFQTMEIDLKGFSVKGIDVTDDVPLIDPLGSDVESDYFIGQLYFDFWLLPFLNLNLLVGHVEVRSDVTLRFTPGFRALVGLSRQTELPEFYSFNTSTSGTMVGLGLMAGFQYEQLIMSLGFNYARTVIYETDFDITSLIGTGFVGYDFGDIGLRALVGVQYVNTDQTIEGRIDLDNGEALPFSIDVGVQETTFMLGFSKDIFRSWNLAALLGANGTKISVSTALGYRW